MSQNNQKIVNKIQVHEKGQQTFEHQDAINKNFSEDRRIPEEGNNESNINEIKDHHKIQQEKVQNQVREGDQSKCLRPNPINQSCIDNFEERSNKSERSNSQTQIKLEEKPSLSYSSSEIRKRQICEQGVKVIDTNEQKMVQSHQSQALKEKEKVNSQFFQNLSLKIYQQKLETLQAKLKIFQESNLNERRIQKEKVQRKKLQKQKQKLYRQCENIKIENRRLYFEKNNITQEKQELQNSNKKIFQSMQKLKESTQKEINLSKKKYHQKMSSSENKIKQKISCIQILKLDLQKEYERKLSQENAKILAEKENAIETYVKNQKSLSEKYRKQTEQVKQLQNKGQQLEIQNKELKELEKRQVKNICSINKFMEDHKIEEKYQNIQSLLAYMSGMMKAQKQLQKKFEKCEKNYCQIIELLGWEQVNHLDIKQRITKKKIKQGQLQQIIKQQQKKISFIEEQAKKNDLINQNKIQKQNQIIQNQKFEWNHQLKALAEENNELKRKFTLEKEEYCQNKEEEKANVKKLKDKQIHRLEEEIQVYKNSQASVCSEANLKFSLEKPVQSLKQLHNYLKQMKMLKKKQVEQQLYFKTSQILKSYPDSVKFLTHVINKVEPDLVIADTKLIFKSDVHNKNLTYVLQEKDYSIMVLCKTKEQIFGAYIEQVCQSPFQHKKTVLFSLKHEIIYPENFRKDKKIRSCYVDSRGLLIFGENEFKITSSLQLVYVGSQQGYFGRIDTKKMFGENLDYSMPIEECQIHFIDFE